MLTTIKDHQTVIKQQPDPEKNPIPVVDETVQHIIPINKSVPQEIFLFIEKQYEFKYSHKKSYKIYSS